MMLRLNKLKNWESEKKDEFISNINIEDINELALLLNNLSEQDSGVVDNKYHRQRIVNIEKQLTSLQY
jgi:hypothetical protein